MVVLSLFVSSSACYSRSVYSSKYDGDIRKYSEQYMPGIPWRLYKCQLIAESNLDPSAVSPAGARGLAQFMPGTWLEVSRRLGYDSSVHPSMAKYAIQAGAYYMGTLRLHWTRKSVGDMERHKFSQASYNAGVGNIGKAWLRAGRDKRWEYVVEWLPRVTGARYAKETKGYVAKIWRLYGSNPRI